MPKDGFKDRIYYIKQETDEERDKRECLEAEAVRIERMCSTYGELGRAYGNGIPQTRSNVEATIETES